jgi:hypothetical protein
MEERTRGELLYRRTWCVERSAEERDRERKPFEWKREKHHKTTRREVFQIVLGFHVFGEWEGDNARHTYTLRTERHAMNRGSTQ